MQCTVFLRDTLYIVQKTRNKTLTLLDFNVMPSFQIYLNDNHPLSRGLSKNVSLQKNVHY